MWTIVAAVLIAVALYVVENYGGNGFVPSWDQIYQWVGLEPSQSETTAPLPEGETEVVFLDVGQGDAVLILQNGAACLIDAGPKDAWQNLVQDLRSYGVSQLDLLVMTHPHADHVGGMQAVLQNFDVQTLLTPDLSETDVTGQTQRTLQTAQECGVPVETAYTGQQYTIGTGTLTVLLPGVDADTAGSDDAIMICRSACGLKPGTLPFWIPAMPSATRKPPWRSNIRSACGPPCSRPGTMGRPHPTPKHCCGRCSPSLWLPAAA